MHLTLLQGFVELLGFIELLEFVESIISSKLKGQGLLGLWVTWVRWNCCVKRKHIRRSVDQWEVHPVRKSVDFINAGSF